MHEENCFEFILRQKNDNFLDLVFIDPPYKKKEINKLIDEIYFKKFLKKMG